MPQAHGADQFAVALGHEREAVGGEAILPQALAGFLEPGAAEAGVEQGLAGLTSRWVSSRRMITAVALPGSGKRQPSHPLLEAGRPGQLC